MCERRGSYSVARLGERYGAEIGLEALLLMLTASCRWQRAPRDRRPRQYQQRYLAYLPDLQEPGPEAPVRPVLKVVGKG